MLLLLACLFSIPVCAQLVNEKDCADEGPDSTSEHENVYYKNVPKLSLINRLLDWIEANTQYEVSQSRKNPPTVNFCTVGELIEYENRQILVDTDLNAAYDSHRRRISIVGSWDPDNIMDQSILLHELVHDVQLYNRSWYCLQEPEWEAYKLQDVWLLEQGVDSGFDWLYIYFLSRCSRDHHP